MTIRRLLQLPSLVSQRSKLLVEDLDLARPRPRRPQLVRLALLSQRYAERIEREITGRQEFVGADAQRRPSHVNRD